MKKMFFLVVLFIIFISAQVVRADEQIISSGSSCYRQSSQGIIEIRFVSISYYYNDYTMKKDCLAFYGLKGEEKKGRYIPTGEQFESYGIKMICRDKEKRAVLIIK